MHRSWRIAGTATLVAILGGVLVGVAVLAQEPDDGSAFPFNFREKLHEAIAGVLGIEVEQYDAAVEQARDQVLEGAVAEGRLTEDQAQRMQERAQQRFSPGMRGGFHGPHGVMGGPGSSLVAVAAEKLGLTVPELVAGLESGKSIADVASANSVNVQDIAGAFLEEHKAWLGQAVEAGRMTQEKADWMLQHVEEEVQQRLSEPFSIDGRGPGGCWQGESGVYGPGRMFPGGMGPGRMNPGQMGPGRFGGSYFGETDL